VGVIAYLRYLNFTFYIDEEHDEFIISDGIINKTRTTIQLNKIQQVNIHQNLIQRIISVYALSVDTAGSDKKEGNIKAISHALALALKAKLLDNESHKPIVKEGSTNQEINEETVSKEALPFLKISFQVCLKLELLLIM